MWIFDFDLLVVHFHNTVLIDFIAIKRSDSHNNLYAISHKIKYTYLTRIFDTKNNLYANILSDSINYICYILGFYLNHIHTLDGDTLASFSLYPGV